MTKNKYVSATEKWLESIVIGLNLCPFAKREWVKNRVRLQLSKASTTADLLQGLTREIILLDEHKSIETTLLIHPFVLTEFYDYNQFLADADNLLIELDRDGIYQIASMHPHYQFTGTTAEDLENYTNRSPYPLLHLIREDSIEVAINNYKDADKIPQKNIELLESMGFKKIQSMLKSCKQ